MNRKELLLKSILFSKSFDYFLVNLYLRYDKIMHSQGSIFTKSPLKNIERIAPNIYNLDIGGYFDLFFYKYP